MPYDFGDLAEPVQAAGKKYDFGDLAEPVSVQEPVADKAPGRKTPMQMSQPSGLDVAASRAQSFARGITDQVTGGAQLLTKMLPKSVVDAGNSLNNWLSKYGLVSEIPKGGIDEVIRNDEAQLAATNKAAGREGTDWMRMGGNIVSPVNVAIAAKAPQAATTLGRVASSMLQGGVSSALMPATSDNFAQEKANQVAWGSVFGGATSLAGSAAARVIRPEVSPQVEALKKAGVSMTPGQLLGGWARSIEEKASSLPFFGEIVHGAERRGIGDFNKAVVNRALAPIGEKLPAHVEAGHEAIEFAADAISKRYDTLLPKLRGQLDRKFVAEIGGIRALSQNMPKDRAEQLGRILDKEVVGRFSAQGKATGETLKQIESKLGGMASGMRRSPDYDQRSMGDALATVQQSLRDMLKRVNPNQAKDLSKINAAYSQFLRPQTAAARTGAEEGIFTPAQLRSAVRELDPSKRKSAYAKGNAQGQEFAQAGKLVLPKKVPDSGTAGRLSLANLPSAALGVGAGLAGGLAYTRTGQKVAQAAMTSRPKGANELARLVRENGRFIGAGTIPLSKLAMPAQGE